jgi:hypothetical protein
MQEGVRQLGGSLKIDSDGHGTTIVATLPFSADTRQQSLKGPGTAALSFRAILHTDIYFLGTISFSGAI